MSRRSVRSANLAPGSAVLLHRSYRWRAAGPSKTPDPQRSTCNGAVWASPAPSQVTPGFWNIGVCPAPGLARRSRPRAGTTLLEVMVVIGVMALMMAVAVPSLSAIWDLEQRGIARDLAQTYRFLQSEATLRNVCFRIVYALDEGGYTIEVGDPSTLVFGTPDQREEALAAQEKQIKLFNKDPAPSPSGAVSASDDPGTGSEARFAGLDVQGFESKVEFPVTTRYGFAYTPQYRQPQEPTPVDEERKEEDGPNVVYSYIFPNGDVEYTVIRIVDVDDPADGYTVEVEPTSGKVTVSAEETEIGASLAWLPESAPESD